MKTLLKYFFFLTLLNSCLPEKFPGEPLHIQNNSTERIYYWYSGEYNTFHYPDTILPINKPVFISSCAASNSNMSSGYDPDWNTIFNQLPEGKLSVYFFDKYANNQEEWEDIRINHVLLRKDVTFDELKNNKYIINFP